MIAGEIGVITEMTLSEGSEVSIEVIDIGRIVIGRIVIGRIDIGMIVTETIDTERIVKRIVTEVIDIAKINTGRTDMKIIIVAVGKSAEVTDSN